MKGGVSLRKLAAKRRVNFRTIHRWVKQFEAELGIDRAEMKKKEEAALAIREELDSAAEIKRLKRELEEARLFGELMSTMIDIAEDQMGIEIRKKPGAKQR